MHKIGRTGAYPPPPYFCKCRNEKSYLARDCMCGNCGTLSGSGMNRYEEQMNVQKLKELEEGGAEEWFVSADSKGVAEKSGVYGDEWRVT